MGIETTLQNRLLSTAFAPLLITTILYTLQHTSSNIIPHGAPQLFARDEEAQCSVDLSSPDACSLVRELCADFDDDGLIPYFRMYACTPPRARPVLLIAMLLWLPVLFGSMAMTAAEFLAVHLEYIVQTIGVSENLAGVTIFAFGNGCTDLFATLAAMGANSGSLAISELFGAAAFITTVVLGIISIIQPFAVDPRSFVGDVVWFMIAGSLLIAFLADGQLVLGECLGIIGLYVAFAAFAILRPGRKETLFPQPVPQEFRDEADVDSNSDDEADDLSQSDIADVGVEVPYSDEPESPYVHELHDAADEIERASDTSPTAQELNDLQLPPSVGSTSDTVEQPGSNTVSDDNEISRNFPPIHNWAQQSGAEKALTILSLPFLLPVGLTIPPRGNIGVPLATAGQSESAQDTPTSVRRSWEVLTIALLDSITHLTPPTLTQLSRDWMFCAQLILGPQLFSLVVVSQSTSSPNLASIAVASSIAFLTSLILIVLSFSIEDDVRPSSKDSLVRSFLAFTIALIWIYLTATSAVTLLMTLALILDIPTALLGATVFAVGQSSNDLVANAAVARRGMPVLAASATFGGPMMNMFMGIGGGGLVQVLKSSNGVYTFNSSTGLFISAGNLLLGLGITLGYAFWNSWRLERGLGLGLIGVWTAFTIANVAVTMA